MTTYSGRSAVIAFGRQSAEGTALSAPKYEIPMGGGWAGPDRDIQDLPWTQDNQDPLGAFVSRANGVVDATLPLLPISSVTLLQAVMGTRATSGAGPYTHAMTMADTLPVLTFFYKQPGGNYWTTQDVKLGSFEISGGPGSPLQIAVSGLGDAPVRSDSAWSAATLVEGVEPFFTYVGATLKMEHSTTPATTAVHNLRNFSLGVNRNIDPIQTDTLGYHYLAEQNRETVWTLNDVVLEDNTWVNVATTGAAAGTSVGSTIAYGSVEFTFIGSDGTAAATRSLKIASPRVQWAIDQIPAADPGGATVSYTLTGKVYKPTSGSSVTATVINGDAGTNY